MKNLITKIKNFTNLEKIFFTFLILSGIYYFYRYIFRFGSEISPSGYTITPFLFQVGKFVLVFVFFVILAVLILKKCKMSEILKQFPKNLFWIPFLCFILYSLLSLLKFTNQWSGFGFTQASKMLFVIPVIFFIPFIWKKKEPFGFFKIFLVFLVAYSLIYNFIMIGLFYIIGRLPGLGFSDILGRFGGGWDDPNGFAAFIVLAITAVLLIDSKKIKGRLYWGWAFLLGLLVVSLLYTFSVTGLVGLFIILALLFFFKKLSWKKFLPIPIFMGIFAVVFYYLDYFNLIYYGKIYSATGHLSTIPVGPQKAISLISIIIKFIFGSNQIIFLENFYLQFFNNFGLIGISLLIFILVLTIYRAFKGYHKTDEHNEPQKKIFFLFAAIYIIAFCLMNLVISVFQDFPINLFFWVIIGLVWTLEIKSMVVNNKTIKR
jgi:hypothetical protein